MDRSFSRTLLDKGATSNYTYPGVNVTTFESEDAKERYIGYTKLTIFDIDQKTDNVSFCLVA